MRTASKHWKHVFKLDPAREIADRALDRLCASGTDAIVVGGTQDITYDNTVELLFRIRRYPLPCVLEISRPEAVVPGFDLYFVPVVLNTRDGEWITGQHRRALRDYGTLLDWKQLVPEGYVILNGQSAAAKRTGADTSLDAKDVTVCAQLAERVFRLPILYIEYSGMFGDMELLQAAASELDKTRLVYGGGIDGPEKAALARRYADTIVVGNAIYDDLDGALATVKMR